MHKAVELVLARMASNPEEYENGRYFRELDPYRTYLTKEEKEALKEAERNICLNILHKRTMERLLVGDQKMPTQAIQEDVTPHFAQGVFNAQSQLMTMDRQAEVRAMAMGLYGSDPTDKPVPPKGFWPWNNK